MAHTAQDDDPTDLSGKAFLAAEVAALYVHRPPYPPDLFKCIADQAPATRRLLDLGAGEGKVARALTGEFDEVVAVDPSSPMIALGKTLANGTAPNITWTCAKAEDAVLEGQFDVVTFASSIHWMDPEALFSKLRRHLCPEHMIAIITGDEAYAPTWQAEWLDLLETWVPRITGRPLGSKEWTSQRRRHLAHLDDVETHSFVSPPFSQSIEAFILCQHARNTFTRSKLGTHAEAFERDVRAVLQPHANASGLVTYRVKSELTLARLRVD